MLTIKQARLLGELSQKNIADALGVHVQTYRKIEANPDLATVAQAKIIADVTGKSYDDIFFCTNSTKSRICAPINERRAKKCSENSKV